MLPSFLVFQAFCECGPKSSRRFGEEADGWLSVGFGKSDNFKRVPDWGEVAELLPGFAVDRKVAGEAFCCRRGGARRFGEEADGWLSVGFG
jgi:hypothetical protein